MDQRWQVFGETLATIGSGSLLVFDVDDSQYTPYYPGGSFSFDATQGQLVWTAIPEPSTALAGLLLTAGLLRRRRNA